MTHDTHGVIETHKKGVRAHGEQDRQSGKISNLVNCLRPMTDPHEIIEWYDERAGVREHMGMLPRAIAEGYALQDVRDRYGVDAQQMVMRHRENDKK